MELREPILSDYSEIAKWIPDAESCLLWAGSSITFPLSAESIAIQLESIDKSKSYCLYVKNELTAFGQFWPRDENTIHLGRIIVSPQKRGLGNGKTLLLSLIRQIRKQENPRQVTLKVFRSNNTAINLYRKIGFEVVESQSNNDSFLMRKDCSSLLGRSE